MTFAQMTRAQIARTAMIWANDVFEILTGESSRTAATNYNIVFEF